MIDQDANIIHLKLTDLPLYKEKNIIDSQIYTSISLYFDTNDTKKKEVISQSNSFVELCFDNNYKNYNYLNLSDLLKKKQSFEESIISLSNTTKNNFDFTAALVALNVPSIQLQNVHIETLALSKEEKKIINYALDPSANPDDVLSTKFNINMTRGKLLCLNKFKWLNDEVINFYMNLLGERKTKLKCHFFNTFFYTKFEKNKYDYESVSRWTKNIDLFEKDKIFVPIHLGTHWVLAVINLKDKRFEYYDSLKGNPYNILDNLRKYIQNESMDKKKTVFNIDLFTDHININIPIQTNGSDCGVFCCEFASYLSKGIELTFTQNDMPLFRKKICLAILKKEEI